MRGDPSVLRSVVDGFGVICGCQTVSLSVYSVRTYGTSVKEPPRANSVEGLEGHWGEGERSPEPNGRKRSESYCGQGLRCPPPSEYEQIRSHVAKRRPEEDDATSYCDELPTGSRFASYVALISSITRFATRRWAAALG